MSAPFMCDEVAAVAIKPFMVGLTLQRFGLTALSPVRSLAGRAARRFGGPGCCFVGAPFAVRGRQRRLIPGGLRDPHGVRR